MDIELVLARVDVFHERRVAGAEAVAEHVDVSDLHARRQVMHDLLHGAVQIVAVLREIAGDTRARCGDDEAGERRRGHRQDVESGAVQGGAQHREFRGIAVAARAGDHDGQRRRMILRGKPHAQPAIEPEHVRHWPRPRQRDVDFVERHARRQWRNIFGLDAEHRRAQTGRIGQADMDRVIGQCSRTRETAHGQERETGKRTPDIQARVGDEKH